MRKLSVIVVMSALVFFATGLGSGLLIAQKLQQTQGSSFSLLSPLISDQLKMPDYEQYSLTNLVDYPYQANKLEVIEVIDQTEKYNEYQFTFTTMDKTMSGLMTLPNDLQINERPKVVILLRGWAPAETYYSGQGTSPAARILAANGYVTLAPDFFGYAKSDPEPTDTWEARFIKPINVIELMSSVEKFGLPIPATESAEDEQIAATDSLPPSQLYFWAHSNGGQIALSVLEILSRPIPTTLWAPVTAPFPYSILFYGDVLEDEGKEQRSWLAMFERNHDPRQYSITQHLDRLRGYFQLHHGTADEAALKTWSDEFNDKIIAENKRRTKVFDEEKDVEEKVEEIKEDELINLEYFVYPGADHNLRPIENWNLAIERDLKFFAANPPTELP